MNVTARMRRDPHKAIDWLAINISMLIFTNSLIVQTQESTFLLIR